MCWEDANIRDPDRTAIDKGRDARLHADHIRITARHSHAAGRGTVGHVRVHVDQSGHDVAPLAVRDR